MSKENDTILTITNHDCSKAMLFFTCKETITAEQVAELYTKHIFPHYGIPRKVISDRDPRFTGRFTMTLCANLGIKQNLSTAYHPQTDGQSERTNQWLEQYLRIFRDYSQNDWANWLPLAQFVHNSWMNETTKQTPFNLLIGGLPVSHYLMTEDRMTKDNQMDRIHEMRSRAQEAITKAQDVMKAKKGTNYKPYQEQDRVWLEATNLKMTHPITKLAPKQYGPFTITKRVSDVVFQLELPHQWKVHNVFHASLLTPYVETELHGPNYPEPPPDISEGDPEFKVEQIVGSRRVGKKKTLQYKVRWKGYSLAHDSWEPVTQVHAQDLIEEFRKISSSKKKNNATINCGMASGIVTTFCLAQQRWAYSPKTEVTCHHLYDSPSKDYESDLPVRDKRKKGKLENNIASPSSIFHINSCTMDNNESRLPPPLSVEELRNMDFSSVDPEKKIYDELLRVMDETYNDPAQDIEAACATEAGPSNPIEGPTNTPIPVTAEEVDELEYEQDPRSKQASPTRTEDMHPGYPYRENIGDNDDLPKLHYSRPYLAAQVDYITGDPRIRGKDERGNIPYDEGPLTVTPWDTVPEDIEDEVAMYPFGEDAYLDTDFLRAMGNLDDRGLVAEALHLV
jgi:hypothetical protein